MMPAMADVTSTAVPGLPAGPPAEPREPETLEFPGCRPVYISRDEIADYEDRIEFWDADTEVAMVCEPVGYYHERPSQRLAKLTDRIAAARGSPIEAVGHTDLLVRNVRGGRQRIMQADQILFLRPAQAIPRGKAIEVGTDALPDVVLEVDNTTDVRRGKLELYEWWGFPEVWVEVPDEPEPSRPASLRAGLTIHLRGEGGFRVVPSSRAFPGWTVEEIHRALNEPESSVETAAALRRVGRALGAAQGTGPDDDPFLREERRESRAEALLETRRAAVLQVLESRGVPVSPFLSRRLAEIEDVSTAGLVRAALECRDEKDFLRLVSDGRRGSP